MSPQHIERGDNGADMAQEIREHSRALAADFVARTPGLAEYVEALAGGGQPWVPVATESFSPVETAQAHQDKAPTASELHRFAGARVTPV